VSTRKQHIQLNQNQNRKGVLITNEIKHILTDGTTPKHRPIINLNSGNMTPSSSKVLKLRKASTVNSPLVSKTSTVRNSLANSPAKVDKRISLAKYSQTKSRSNSHHQNQIQNPEYFHQLQ
jgi:hypothetical protein